jgi:hypothetical protein
VVAEYALRDVGKPMGISRYELAGTLPEELKANLPAVEEIEAEFGKKGMDEEKRYSLATSVAWW